MTAALRRPWSLQTLLVAAAFAITLSAWAAGSLVMWRVAEDHAARLHDFALRKTGEMLLGLAGNELAELTAETPLEGRITHVRVDTGAVLGNDYRYQLWTRNGELLLANFGSGHGAPLARFDAAGFSWTTMDGERWRVFNLVSVQDGQELHLAERAAARSWFFSAIDPTALALVPLSLLLVLLPAVLLMRRLMRPLRQVHEELDQRTPTNLSQLQVEAGPAELRPIIAALNGLFERVAAAMQRERNFTALAAHELRTPMAGVRLLAQSVGSAPDDAARERAVTALVESVDRCTHLQDQLLTLARLDAADAADANDPEAELYATEVLMEAVAEVAPLARARRVKIVTRADGALLRGRPFGVRTLIRNLLANAIKYSPDGARVGIVLQARGDDVVLTIDDAGPGIPAEERDRMFERFQRGRGDRRHGAGLGLAIVRAVALAHGAEVSLSESPEGGLRAEVRFSGRRAGMLDIDAAAAMP